MVVRMNECNHQFWIQPNGKGIYEILEPRQTTTIEGDIIAHKPGVVMFDGEDGVLRRIILGDRKFGFLLNPPSVYEVKDITIMTS